MRIKGLTKEQIIECAKQAGAFKLDNVRTIGNYTAFVLRMTNRTPMKARKDTIMCGICNQKDGAHADLCPGQTDMRYRKRSVGRMIHGTGPTYGTAVCFHGHRAFMREIFKLNPNAIIRTAKAAYLGTEDFERKWQAVAEQNVGSAFCPVMYYECCDC